MKLVYRGLEYFNKKITNIVNPNQHLTAKYRGISYQISFVPKPANSVDHILKYRGINYHSHPNNNDHQKSSCLTGSNPVLMAKSLTT
ncbi:DUF4278 domain-containing protein [Cyanothece sp. BG0011]|uniref:DUF4278 domain-containing protein n=1 Tax=Cyanothece sp. BG0011 TaxID=2082950 RepID=UPI000D1E8A02|nr:DUF4278 domain-containing protein [Cyanothece sp. BG0011]